MVKVTLVNGKFIYFPDNMFNMETMPQTIMVHFDDAHTIIPVTAILCIQKFTPAPFQGDLPVGVITDKDIK